MSTWPCRICGARTEIPLNPEGTLRGIICATCMDCSHGKLSPDDEAAHIAKIEERRRRLDQQKDIDAALEYISHWEPWVS